MRKEALTWDLLLAQSESAANNLRTGLGYTGEIYLGEYPRNIRFLSEQPEYHNIRLRSKYGIPEGQKIVLYAPTWRQSHKSGKKWQWEKSLPIQELANRTDTLVLVRSHHITIMDVPDQSNLIDVSACPHVEDLIAVADVLVTDYSSIAFDYSSTGKPVIHYISDEKDYQHERGLYPDWPKNQSNVAVSLDEVVEKIKDSKSFSKEARGAPDLHQLIEKIFDAVESSENHQEVRGSIS